MSEPHQELRRRFHLQLDAIDAKVIRLFAMVTEGVAAASDALLTGDTDSARALSERDRSLDELEIDVEQVAERELLMETPMAGDMRYLAVSMVVAAGLFLVLAGILVATGAGLGWLWTAIGVLMLARLATLVARLRTDAWLVTGAIR